MKSTLSVETLADHVAETLAAIDSDAELQRVVVAVSGGADSIALLHVLATIDPDKIICAHFNHKLRPDNDTAEDAVRSLCTELKVTFVEGKPKSEPGGNIEAWARLERYRFLQDVLGQYKADAILTAHHRGDQAETLLFRLVSGRLSNSAFCVASWDPERKIARPLIEVSKTLILNYVREHNLPVYNDPSNEDLEFSRNYLRHEILPRLASALNPSIERALCGVADRLSEDEQYLYEQAVAKFEGPLQRRIDERLFELPEALQWRVVREALRDSLLDYSNAAGRGDYQRVIELLRQKGEPGRRVQLRGGTIAIVQGDRSLLFDVEAVSGFDSKLTVPGQLSITVSPAETITLGSDVVAEKISLDQIREQSASARAARFDLKKIDAKELRVRNIEAGDEVDVYGRGRRKLSTLFKERDIRYPRRQRWPLVCCGAEIIWVPGVCRSSYGLVDASTESQLALSLLD